MAKTIKEMIEVMEHYENGGEVECGTIECIERDCYDWEIVDAPCWNWYDFDYRIAISKQKVTIEKWLIEENDIKFVVETSDIDSWLKSFPTAQKLKLIESYEVEI